MSTPPFPCQSKGIHFFVRINSYSKPLQFTLHLLFFSSLFILTFSSASCPPALFFYCTRKGLARFALLHGSPYVNRHRPHALPAVWHLFEIAILHGRPYVKRKRARTAEICAFTWMALCTPSTCTDWSDVRIYMVAPM